MKALLKKFEELFDEWTGAYEFIPLLCLIGIFAALWKGKLMGMDFVAALTAIVGAFHLGGAAAAKHKHGDDSKGE